MSNALTCARCGQRIVGNGHRYLGKVYCSTCYDEVMEETMALENDKQELYDYIKNLFGKSECPNEVIFMIDQQLRTGKKVRGIQATLYYYYEILGHDTNNILGLGRVLQEQYENARDYTEQVNKNQELNRQVNLNVEPKNIKIPRPCSKKRLKYKLEDL